jgi:NAD(P)H-dependent flavin oxidoreductase YrpB (nitropropane dioxygenase family)
MAAALALGADAVALGTRFVASHDNVDWDPAYAQRILAAKEGEDIIFQAVYGPSRALPSKGITELREIEAKGDLDITELTAWKDERLIAAQRDGDVDTGILPAGQVSGAIGDLVHVDEFIPAMVADAARTLERLSGRVLHGD